MFGELGVTNGFVRLSYYQVWVGIRSVVLGNEQQSNNALKSDPLQRAFQLRLRIFTSAKRAVMGGLAQR